MPIHYKLGDAIEGERIIAKTQKIGKYALIRKSSQHRGTEIHLEKWAFCVIDREIRAIRDKKVKKV
ncbi:hypothetical protein JXO59_11040 [candidate division KSB1 bacterium]|nr:hypothetical protein [candidate division KSB1 bacterium]